METGNIKALGLAMNRSQAIYEAKLAGRFESTHDPQLLQQIRSLIDLGAIGAKFSGAGGDGSVIGLFSTENSARASAISMDHTLGNAWYISVGVP
jgi:mevalonate kinase